MYLNNLIERLDNQVGGAEKSNFIYLFYFLIFIYLISPGLFTGLIMSGNLGKDSEGNPKGPKGKFTDSGKGGLIGLCVVFYLVLIVYLVQKFKLKSNEKMSTIKFLGFTFISIVSFVVWCLFAAQTIGAPSEEETGGDEEAN